MCGRFHLTDPAGALVELFDLEPPAFAIRPRWNAAPGQEILAVRAGSAAAGASGTGLEATLLRWGLESSRRPVDDAGPRPINARAETLAERPAFRDAFRLRRAVVPVDGFYEWQRGEPFRIVRPSHRPFALAAIWEAGSRDEPSTCAIVTTAAAPTVAEVHDRMPAILEGDALARWLDPAIADPAELAPLLVPWPGRLELIPASRRVGDVKNDGPELFDAGPRQASLF
jgi:putative SOS response-associated peptidase YedK